jgi:hypothetical protein
MTAHSSSRPDLEILLARALSPVEPPEHLGARLEDTLTTITALAADELEAWELRTLHDPRTWVRPAAAAAIGTVAAGGLAVLQARRRRGRRRAGDADPLEFAAGAVRTISGEIERRVRR